MNGIKIRTATADDAQTIRQVQHDVWIETYPNDELGITREAIKQRVSKYITREYVEKLKAHMSDQQQRTWVASDNTKIIGYCTAEKGADLNHLRAIYVLPAYHGRGVGEQLLTQALSWLGMSRNIQVEVASYNSRAIRFYEKNGFEKNGVEGFSEDIPTVHLTRQASAVLSE